MATKLKEACVPVETTLHGAGSGPDAHGLAGSARIAAGWCYKDLATEELVRKAAEGLRG